MTIVVDKKFELERVEKLEGEANFPEASKVWTLPEDIEQNIHDIRDHYERWWPERGPLPKKPSVRVVMDVDGIFNGEDRNISLRCKPCIVLAV